MWGTRRTQVPFCRRHSSLAIEPGLGSVSREGHTRWKSRKGGREKRWIIRPDYRIMQNQCFGSVRQSFARTHANTVLKHCRAWPWRECSTCVVAPNTGHYKKTMHVKSQMSTGSAQPCPKMKTILLKILRFNREKFLNLVLNQKFHF